MPSGLGKALDGVPQHGSGHGRSMFPEKILQRGLVSFTDFPEHPAHGLVDQVFLVGQEQAADLERVNKFGG